MGFRDAAGPRRAGADRPEGIAITFEVVGDAVYVRPEWAPGTPLSSFAEMLANLQRGQYVDLVNNNIERFALDVGEPDKGAAVKAYVTRTVARDHAGGPGTPVVDATHAVRALAKQA